MGDSSHMDSESRSQNQSHVVKKRELSVVLSGSCVIIVALPGNQPGNFLRGDGSVEGLRLRKTGAGHARDGRQKGGHGGSANVRGVRDRIGNTVHQHMETPPCPSVILRSADGAHLNFHVEWILSIRSDNLGRRRSTALTPP